jgi:ribosomal protein S24E
MELTIQSNEENKLMGRKEIRASATSTDKTPTKAEVKEELCKKLNLDPALSEIREIRQEYGLRVSDILLYAYDSKEIMDKSVRKRGEKGKKAEAKSGAGAAPAAPAAK